MARLSALIRPWHVRWVLLQLPEQVNWYGIFTGQVCITTNTQGDHGSHPVLHQTRVITPQPPLDTSGSSIIHARELVTDSRGAPQPRSGKNMAVLQVRMTRDWQSKPYRTRPSDRSQACQGTVSSARSDGIRSLLKGLGLMSSPLAAGPPTAVTSAPRQPCASTWYSTYPWLEHTTPNAIPTVQPPPTSV